MLIWNILFLTFFVQKVNADDDSVNILFVDGSNVALLDISSGNVTIIDTGYAWSMYVDYHYGYVYVGDHNSWTITRIPFPPKNGEKNVIIEQGHSRPVGITVDSKNYYVYWMDDNGKTILRANLDGSNKTEILRVSGYTRGLAVDAHYGWIYFGAGSLQRCRFDGSERVTIVREIGYYGNIALDIGNDRMYWVFNVDQTSALKSASLNGSNVIVIHQTVEEFMFPVDFSGDYLYFAVYNRGRMYRKLRHDLSSTPELIYTSPNSLIICMKVYEENENECLAYSTITDGGTRSANFSLDYFEYSNSLSDHMLLGGWYKIKSPNGDVMPNYPPGISSCGTVYPIWLNGTLPGPTERNQTFTACVETAYDKCEYSVEIRITNCGKYYVYFLQSTPMNSSFCFGNGPVRCPQHLSSESGFYPGCDSSFPNDTLAPEVITSLVEGPIFVPKSSSLIPVFQCLFNVDSSLSYVYDVYWYINGDEVVVFKNKAASEIGSSHLKGSHWVNTHRMNMEVRCSVRIRNSANSIPSPFHQSPLFKAGLFPEKYEYTVIEGESINITLTNTVPVGCLSSNPLYHSVFCRRSIISFVPNLSSSERCSNNVALGDIVFKSQSCGTVLETTNYTQVKILQVYGFSDGKYNYQARPTYIRLSTKLGGDPKDVDIWVNLTVPDIKVNVIDKDAMLSGRVCQCFNDPHFRTFDGMIYHYMEVGEFALYRNDRGPYWVHALFSNCGFGWTGSSCNCGVAVRSRNSLFVIRTCKRVSRTETEFLTHPHIEKRSCDESDLYITVQGNRYTIKLPIGTEIRFSVSSSSFIPSISIKPSIYDIAISRGLCGVPSINIDVTDDFVHKITGMVVDEKSFADSWRISPNSIPNEQLFIADPSYLLNIDDGDTINSRDNTTTDRYCVCERKAGQSDKFEDFFSFHCNLTQPTDSCSKSSEGDSTSSNQNTITAFPTSCTLTVNRRKRSVSQHHLYRRSLDDSDDVIERKDIEFDESVESNYSRNETIDFKDGWSEETARETCERKLNNTIPTDVFEDSNGINDTHYIESCILDIKMTASTEFLKDTVSAMQTYTLIEVLRNETLENSTTEDGSQTVLDYVTSQLCPGDCNNNGNCTLGNCYCFNGFYGEDCTGSTSIPPQNYSLPTSGLCGTRSRACQRTNIYGNFLSEKVWCRKKYFQISGNITTYSENYITEQAVYRNQFMVSVDITPPSVNRRKRSTNVGSMADGYEISLSNDGNTFGDLVIIIIYDEECNDCHSSSMVCVSVSTCPDYTSTEDITSVESSTQHMTTGQDATSQLLTTADTSTGTRTPTEDITTVENSTQYMNTKHNTTTQLLTTYETLTHRISTQEYILSQSEQSSREEASTTLSSESSTDETLQYKSSEEKSTTTSPYKTTELGISTAEVGSTTKDIDTATILPQDFTTLFTEINEAKNEQNSTQLDRMFFIIGGFCLGFIIILLVVFIFMKVRRSNEKQRDRRGFEGDHTQIQNDSLNFYRGWQSNERGSSYYSAQLLSGGRRNYNGRNYSFFNEYFQSSVNMT